jgi:hypothetical protein
VLYASQGDIIIVTTMSDDEKRLLDLSSPRHSGVTGWNPRPSVSRWIKLVLDDD